MSLDIICSSKLTFPRASLSGNCSLLGTDNILGQLSVHISSPKVVYCLYIPRLGNQSNRAKSTIHLCCIYWTLLHHCACVVTHIDDVDVGRFWNTHLSRKTQALFRARSFGTIPFIPIPEWAVLVFFWELFLFRNERNAIPFILLPIAEWTEKYCVFCYSYSEIGINGIVPKERALNVAFLRWRWTHCVPQELVGEISNYPDIDMSQPGNEANDDFMFPDDLDDLDSDAENELLEDAISIISTPKPCLR